MFSGLSQRNILKLSVFKKQVVSALFLITVIVGVITPITATIIPEQGVAITPTIAYADEGAKTYTPSDTELSYIEPCKILTSAGFMGCITRIFYAVPYSLGFWALTLAAQVLDGSAAITLSSRLFTKADFVYTGWQITRDFANIFFILILLYISISLILGLKGPGSPKRVLADLVLVALLVNFSLFVTQVVIDASNSLALVFYNQIALVQDGKKVKLNEIEGTTKIFDEESKPISVMLAEGMKPQKLAQPEFYRCLASQDFFGGDCAKTTTNDSSFVPASVMIPLLIVMGALFLVAAYSFFVVSLAFISRIVTLWISIIFAPLAFVSYIVPSLRSDKKFGWTKWSNDLIAVAFSAPIYFFFMLFISFLVGAPWRGVYGSSPAEILMLAIIETILIIALILRATNAAKEGGGLFADKIVGFGTGLLKTAGLFTVGAAGAAVGAAAGATAIAGRKSIGRLASSASKSERLKNIASGAEKGRLSRALGGRGEKIFGRFDRWAAEQRLTGAEKLSTSSFDIRRTKVADVVAKNTGVSFESVGSLSTKSTAGGWVAAENRAAEKLRKMETRLGGNKARMDEIDEVLNKRKKAIEDKEHEVAAAGKTNEDIKDLEAKIENMRKTPVPYDPMASEAEMAAREAKKAEEITKMEGELTTKRASFKSEKALKKELQELKGGMRGEIKAGDKLADGTTAQDDKEAKLAGMGLGAIEKLKENAEKDRFRMYLYTKARESGYKANIDNKDVFGSIKKFSVDTKNAYGDNNILRATTRTLNATAIGTAIGTVVAPGLGTAVGGAVAGAMVGLLRELVNSATGSVGRSVIQAQAAELASSGKKLDTYSGKEKKYTGTRALSTLRRTFQSTFK